MARSHKKTSDAATGSHASGKANTRPNAKTGSRQGANAAFGSRTDIGCVREHNEDSLIVAPPLYAVADGMGGHAAGEVASEIAVRTLADLAPATADTEGLAQAVASSNYAVINAARAKGRAGMGTTLTAAILDRERLAIAQVGDSRAYLLHNGKMQQLTRDHSLMADMIEAGELTEEEARTHPQRSVITRALGSDPDMQPDLYELNVTAGDRLLLCSDGLSTMVDDDQILSTLSRIRDPQRCASMLVNQAIQEGGHDNITVIVVDVEGNAVKQQKKVRRRSRAWAVFIVLLLLAAVAGICYGAYAYTQHAAYLTAEDGKVVVYRGVPDTVAGFPLSTFDHATDVQIADLQPGTANRLTEGVVSVDDLEAADALVAQYQQEIAEAKAAEQAKEAAAKEAAAKRKEEQEAQAAAEAEAQAMAEAQAAAYDPYYSYYDPSYAQGVDSTGSYGQGGTDAMGANDAAYGTTTGAADLSAQGADGTYDANAYDAGSAGAYGDGSGAYTDYAAQDAQQTGEGV